MQTTSTTLLAKAQARDNEAWFRLYALYEPLIHLWVERDPVSKPEAEDLVQNVLLAAHQNLPSFEKKQAGSFRKWLRVITSNQVNEFLRKKRPQLASESLFQRLANPTNELEQQWNAEYDRHVVLKLLTLIQPEFGEQTWQIFTMTELQEISPSEVAKKLKITTATVYMARNRVLARLKEIGTDILEHEM